MEVMAAATIINADEIDYRRKQLLRSHLTAAAAAAAAAHSLLTLNKNREIRYDRQKSKDSEAQCSVEDRGDHDGFEQSRRGPTATGRGDDDDDCYDGRSPFYKRPSSSSGSTTTATAAVAGLGPADESRHERIMR